MIFRETIYSPGKLQYLQLTNKFPTYLKNPRGLSHDDIAEIESHFLSDFDTILSDSNTKKREIIRSNIYFYL